ncbi:unnamed protein product [Microthlaspi erraticum]|uniref:Leucine-rich repeat-containing N-terminal plant-type domain-containing protein n=1 Tax=Microthlaspi erraticum TaxID=1685480 RepID=A0A6D2I6Z6_9BRAS|nr:unnamed protein product [Microthlaspi erraticum]
MEIKMRSWWWVKEKKKQMALVFITVMMILQFQMKGCVGCVETERMGLLQLKSYLNSFSSYKDENILKSWIDDDPTSDCCNWESIKCSDAIGGHIVDLSLSLLTSLSLDQTCGLNLSLLHTFPQLKTLDLSLNDFSHLFDPIHGYKSFQRLQNLEFLDLSYNKFNYSLNNFRELEELDLSLNSLHDFEAGDGLRKTKLKKLDLSSNIFSNTSRLKGIEHFVELEVLSLAFNQFNPIQSIQGLRKIKLKELDLRHNEFSDIAGLKVLKDMPKLQELDLSGNDFTDLDSLGLVFPSSLQVLDLQNNQLSSAHKGYSKLCGLMNLQKLDLKNNALTSMPNCLGNLSRLRTLDLSNNQLNGNLSSFVSGLPSALEYLFLIDNNFNGSFLFNSLVNQTRLTILTLSSKVGLIQTQAESSWVPLFQLKILKLQNFILGSTIPGFLFHQHDLYYVDLSHNKLTGPFPTWLVQNNPRLEAILLNNNRLTELQLPRLVHGLISLDISSNMINDSIQEDIGVVFPTLRFMNVSSNHFHGTIPYLMGEMKTLASLDMSSNGLSGQLPKTFLSGCYSLEFLRLSNNQFQAESLEVLDLRNNNFSGKILNTMSKMSRLRVLLLRNNNLQSHIPEKICQLSEVGLLDLSHNKFSGAIPSCLGNMSFGTERDDDRMQWETKFIGTGIQFLQNWSYIPAINPATNDEGRGIIFTIGTVVDFLTKNRYEAYQGDIIQYMYGLDLSSNRLSGEIPVEIGNLVNIRCLNFSSNRLTGSIPYNISKLKNLESLDLSNNKLYGKIPPVLTDLNSLGYFNVSCNNFSGEIPFKGHLVTFDNRSYIGNAHLCGLPTNISCNPTKNPEANALTHSNEEEDDVMIDMEWFYWTCGAVYISTSLALLAFLCIDSRWYQEWFYHVDLFIHHLQRYKRFAFGN